MRKNIKATEADLYDALDILHYTRCSSQNPCPEWRHQQFHLFIRKKGKEIIALSLHEDMPSSLPPFHRAKHQSKALEVEVNKILDAYQKRRASKRVLKTK